MRVRYLIATYLAKFLLVVALGCVTLVDALAEAGVEQRRATGAATATQWQPLAPAAAARAVEAYFNGLTTLRADFTQQVTGEDFASEGTFYLKRPSRFLWQYDTPVRQKVVGTGTAVYFVDQSSGRDGQVTQLPVNAGFGRLLAGRSLSLREAGLRAVSARQNARVMEVTLEVASARGADESGVRSITLRFDRLGKALALQQAQARDVTGAMTRVSLRNLKAGVVLPRSMFDYTPGVYDSKN